MTLAGSQYRVACTLYSKDGKRSAEVREFSNGETYLLESEWVEGSTFAERHSGRLVGPFPSPTDAERFIIASSWFKGTEPSLMKPRLRITVTDLAASVAVLAWLLTLFFVAGVWLDCIPNDIEYGCPTRTSAWEQTVAALIAVSLFTLVLWLGARRSQSRS